ncbi:MAG TPA: hypothetical protein VIJ35_29830 [Bradyrhizobium sp.]
MLPARATFAYDAVPAVSAAVLRAAAHRAGEEITKWRQVVAS